MSRTLKLLINLDMVHTINHIRRPQVSYFKIYAHNHDIDRPKGSFTYEVPNTDSESYANVIEVLKTDHSGWKAGAGCYRPTGRPEFDKFYPKFGPILRQDHYDQLIPNDTKEFLNKTH